LLIKTINLFIYLNLKGSTDMMLFVHPLENTFASQPERKISDEAEHNYTKMSLRKNATAQ
jgi:hypothetical protein